MKLTNIFYQRAYLWIIIGIMIFSFTVVASASSLDQDVLKRSRTELEQLRESIRNTSLPLLVLLKQLDTPQVDAMQQHIRVIRTIAPVRESYVSTSTVIVNVRLNEEFPVEEKHDEWYLVELPDGRRGWVQEDMVQVYSSPATGMHPKTKSLPSREQENILVLASGMIESINIKYDSASVIFSAVDAGYENLSIEARRPLVNLYREYVQERDKIREYYHYANFYYNQLAAHWQLPGPGTGLPDVLSGVQGNLTIQMGQSAYENGGEESLTSRTISFTGTKILDHRSRISAALNHRNDVIQTPFTANDVRFGYEYRRENGLNINGRIGYSGYDDKLFERNNFNQFSMGTDILYPMSRSSEFFSQLSFDSRNYREEGGNSYDTGGFRAGVRFDTPGSEMTLQLRGTIQSSDISFLEFNRFIPQFQYIKKKRVGSFSANVELEQLTYASESKANNYQRERLDLVWNLQNSRYQLSFIGKQFPNNSLQDYFKFGLQTGRHSIGRFSYSRSGASLLLTYFPNGGSSQVHYIDLRYDHHRTGKSSVFEYSLFGRVWDISSEEVVRDHFVDLFLRYGVKFSFIEVGPLVGAYILINENEDVIEREGNSLRAGVDFSANFLIKKSTVHISTRYEKNFVYSHELSISPTGQATRGELVVRQPHTFTLMVSARIPIVRNLDFTIDINRYDIGLDVDEKTSVDFEPISSRTRMIFRAGLGYRFGS